MCVEKEKRKRVTETSYDVTESTIFVNIIFKWQININVNMGTTLSLQVDMVG